VAVVVQKPILWWHKDAYLNSFPAYLVIVISQYPSRAVIYKK